MVLAKSIAICSRDSRDLAPPTCSYHEQSTTSNVLRRIVRQSNSLGVLRRQSKSHEVNRIPIHSGRRPWDAWEEKSLKKQCREFASQGCVKFTGYSRRPEILAAIEKLKSKTHS